MCVCVCVYILNIVIFFIQKQRSDAASALLDLSVNEEPESTAPDGPVTEEVLLQNYANRVDK